MTYCFSPNAAKLKNFLIKDYHKPLLSRYDRWRRIAARRLSSQARLRLEWMIFYETVGRSHATRTASHFGISRKTLHKWLKRFEATQLASLEDRSRRPQRVRSWEVSLTEEDRIISLRTQHLKYGKAKLSVLYQQGYGETISTWKIERVVRKHRLYPDPEAHRKRMKRQKRRKTRLHIHELSSPSESGRLWHTDTIILWWYGQRRVIFTAIEDSTKLGYARVYLTGSSRQARDFLERLVYLSDAKIKIVHSDNGSEFAGEFSKACEQLDIIQVYNRVRTPQDNASLERFNWTVQDEWLTLSEVGLDDLHDANQDLTEWLIEYNAHRPHEALAYQTPLAYAQQTYFKVLPMWSASTRT